MDRANRFFIIPIQQFIQYKAFQEERGKSCVSGNINDMVCNGIPGILPSFYPLHKELEQIVDRYETSTGFEDLLVNWISNQPFNQMKEKLDLAAYLSEVKVQFRTLF